MLPVLDQLRPVLDLLSTQSPSHQGIFTIDGYHRAGYLHVRKCDITPNNVPARSAKPALEHRRPGTCQLVNAKMNTAHPADIENMATNASTPATQPRNNKY
jgi:hypothetical protein